MENEFVLVKVSRELLHSFTEKRSAPVELQFSSAPSPDGTYELTAWTHHCKIDKEPA